MVYGDDFILIAPPQIEKKIRTALEGHIIFKDPPEVCHH